MGGEEIYPDANFGLEPYMIEIGNHVRINSGVQFVTHDGGVWIFRQKEDTKDVDLFGRINVGNNVHIGTNSIIMPGVTIGDNVVVGCGAIVTHNIPDNSIAVGVPARVIENVEQYYSKNKEAFDFTKQLSPKDKRAYLTKKYSL